MNEEDKMPNTKQLNRTLGMHYSEKMWVPQCATNAERVFHWFLWSLRRGFPKVGKTLVQANK